jgi:hypothetical protein
MLLCTDGKLTVDFAYTVLFLFYLIMSDSIICAICLLCCFYISMFTFFWIAIELALGGKGDDIL